jgi:hypothetical protein
VLLRNLWFNVAVGVSVAAASGYLDARRQRWGEWLPFALFAFYAAYCAQNFVRCREVHCAITAPGFALAALLALLRAAGVEQFGSGVPWVVFLLSACAGYCLQSAYKARTGSIFLQSAARYNGGAK